MNFKQPLYNPYDPFETADERHRSIISLSDGRCMEFTITEIRSIKDQCTKIINDYDFNRPILGPTTKQLNSNPALKNAWEEFMVVRKLTGCE